jgi:hypothetical protein
MRRALLGLLLLAVVLAGLVLAPVEAQEQPIQILSEEIENNFPVELLFHIDVASKAAPIDRIKLAFRTRGSISLTKNPLEFEPNERVQSSYRWYTEFANTPPGAPVFYHWEIHDKAGNTLSTEPKLHYYDDLRFDWQKVEDEDLTVLWYEGGEEFGQELYDVSSISLREMIEGMNAELDFPIRVVVYANRDDFHSAFLYRHEWTGGISYPGMGLTVQIIAPWEYAWMTDVLPHEIAHQIFFQLTDNAYVIPPTWLNEGIAQYNEWVDHSYEEELVADAAAEERLLPMPMIVGGFPPDDRVYLAYAQSYSLVKMLIETYGWEAMGRYLNAYKTAPISFDEEVAFEEVYGLSFDDFLAAWLDAIGAVGNPVLNPTDAPLLPATTSTPPEVTPVPTEEPAGPTETAVASTAEPTAEPVAPTEMPADDTSSEEDSGGGWPCASVGLLVFPLVLLWRRRREVS